MALSILLHNCPEYQVLNKQRLTKRSMKLHLAKLQTVQPCHSEELYLKTQREGHTYESKFLEHPTFMQKNKSFYKGRIFLYKDFWRFVNRLQLTVGWCPPSDLEWGYLFQLPWRASYIGCPKSIQVKTEPILNQFYWIHSDVFENVMGPGRMAEAYASNALHSLSEVGHQGPIWPGWVQDEV